MKYCCTYFDKAYFSRGIALLESMEKHCGEFVIWVLCLDPYVHEKLAALNLEFVRLITSEQLEAATAGLAEACAKRSTLTCCPALPMFVLRDDPRRGRHHVPSCRSLFLLQSRAAFQRAWNGISGHHKA